MRKIIIADATLRRKAEISAEHGGTAYSFKAVIETAKLLDRAGVDVIEMGPVTNKKTDGLILKTTAAAVSAKLSVIGGMTAEQIDTTWDVLKSAKSARIVVALPVSSVQMEYLCHKKPAAMLETITALVSHASSLCADVEFSAVDATRADRDFVAQAVNAAAAAGAKTVTICDTAGIMMPWEFPPIIAQVRENVSADVAIGAECYDNFGVATASALDAIMSGCSYIKTSTCGCGLPSLLSICSALSQRSDAMASDISVKMTALKRTCSQISAMWDDGRSRSDIDDDDTSALLLDSHSDINALRSAAESMGYDLSEADLASVYDVFRAVAEKKEVTQKELEAIIATSAMQVPTTYILDSFVINSGNIITSTAHIVLDRDGRKLEGVSVGDGPIDAAFLAIEQIIGHHFELDDFQIQSVTEGREAVGDAIVKLRSQGRLYSGRGISTDIVGASIAAYISALNKIVYEERGI